ncbi:3-oxo-5-alpha-steroid 4-dehydrogenase 2-like [Solea senegalensis]|uniref:3-oxo-5alpha-steroid 4-dehydrogenase (NADP(+)) n=1 Tax=Solea senegalensis TaxID=28829 RepID=A0AAV6QCJ6_SOLSE|nr:3-oxo-5-alpha-steroid 4-dehydrogenase 2-like [Solea senegalensis]KAG7486248.1 3-oxo-5-alpha-steroid 4-dehydrogenase 2-like [Solea senegalensis]
MMPCLESPVFYLSWSLVVGGALYFWQQTRVHTPYGRYTCERTRCCSARLGWFLQEVPSLLVPLLLLLLLQEEETGTSPGTSTGTSTGRTLLLCTFMLHYFHRSCIYAFLTRGRPLPLMTVVQAAIFCSVNGFLQSHHLLHCTHFPHSWSSSARQAGGFLLFVVGLSINVHSDHILRNLRRPGEVVYRIPHGGMFEFVSAANFFGEIVEWCGYAVVTWTFPAFAFAFFSACSIGPRAFHHHRDYQQRFEDYPRCRKALIPFIL